MQNPCRVKNGQQKGTRKSGWQIATRFFITLKRDN